MCFSDSLIVLTELVNVLTTNSNWLWMVPCLHVAALVFRKWSNKSLRKFGVPTFTCGLPGVTLEFLHQSRGSVMVRHILARPVVSSWCWGQCWSLGNQPDEHLSGCLEKKISLNCKWFIGSAKFSAVSVHDGVNRRAPELYYLKAF